MKNSKLVRRIITAQAATEGEGFLVYRTFPIAGVSHLDPFLLLDEMGPADLGPGEAKGAPDHPHRGFETVTYMLSGEMEHRDSAGNSGRISQGDVQWMTAGRGVIHSEMPSRDFLRTGGRMHGFQLWVNLPAKEKMIAPRYQEIPSIRIPRVALDGAEVRVIAGEVRGTRAVIDTRTPIVYLDYVLKPSARIAQPIPAEFNSFAYVYEGEGAFSEDRIVAKRPQLVLFDHEGDQVVVRNESENELRFLLLAGKPLHERVARYGPFVMNTTEELEKAFWEYQRGTFLNPR